MPTIKKKILFFHFDLGGGGAEKVLVNLLNHLNPEKYDITLQTIFGVGPNLKDLNSNVHFKCLFKREFRGFNTIMKLFSPRILHKLLVHNVYDIEIGYMENSPTRIISGCENKKSKKLAWVHTTFDDLDACTQAFRSLNEIKHSYNSFDRIVFVSEQAKSIFEQKLPQIATPKIVLHNVTDIARIKELSNEECPILIDKKSINLCSVGRLIRVKGYERLLRCLYILHKDPSVPFFKFYLLGKGAEESELKELITNLDLDGIVYLLGYDKNPYRYVSRMDLFICSSYKEGYSTAVTEAVSLGIPVITTNCSGMDEILDNGRYGKIVLNSEKALLSGLRELLINTDEISKYRKNIANSLKFNTSILINKYQELFDSL